MKVLGITGGVGSGKSRILRILEQEYCAQVIQADLVAKELQEPGAKGYVHLVKALGSVILDASGNIDRSRLAAMIFDQPSVRLTVNAIIHPITWAVIADRIGMSDRALVVVEAALLDEKTAGIYDELWYVYASEEVRIKRLSEGRGYTRERIQAMMDSQPTDEEYRRYADVVIDNDSTLDELRSQIYSRLGKRQGTS